MAETVKAKRGCGTPSKPYGIPAPSSPLMTIPMAGREYYGLSVNASYAAADEDKFGPVIEMGRRKYVTRAGVEQRIATLGKLPSPKVPATATDAKRKAITAAAKAAAAADNAAGS
jgi:hypothetical protein